MEEVRAGQSERLFASLSGVIFVLAGMSLLAMTLLTPAWLSCRELASRRDIMQAQLTNLQSLQDRYQHFQTSLENDDPVLIERLAFTELHQKPASSKILHVNLGGSDYTGQREANRAQGQSIFSWLSQYVPVEQQAQAPAYQPINSKLVRMTNRTNSRWLLLGFGVCCVFVGMWPKSYEIDADHAADQS
ncbi:hypothetical protein [Poriferisphaera sp. WC338]|uniref:hypothetical protein n=1 Tax=Poriferisphaera sp. WC338 TaxID=3425129 RepID=UPI003D814016